MKAEKYHRFAIECWRRRMFFSFLFISSIFRWKKNADFGNRIVGIQATMKTDEEAEIDDENELMSRNVEGQKWKNWSW